MELVEKENSKAEAGKVVIDTKVDGMTLYHATFTKGATVYAVDLIEKVREIAKEADATVVYENFSDLA